MFPTSWLSEEPAWHGWVRHELDTDTFLLRLGDEGKEALNELDLSARAFLLAARQLGFVVCVTLSRRPWVTRCLNAFLPSLKQVWQELDIEVVYARELIAFTAGSSGSSLSITDDQDDEHIQWKEGIFRQKKRKAMKRIFQRFYNQKSWKNVISFGDGSSEKEALREIGFQHNNPVSRRSGEQKPFRIKTIKLKEEPRCASLTAELQSLHSWLPAIVSYEDDIDIDLNGDADEEELPPDLPDGLFTRQGSG
jgi:hypothetical protein